MPTSTSRILLKSLKKGLFNLPVALHFLQGKPFLFTFLPSHLKHSGASSPWLSSDDGRKLLGFRMRQLVSFSLPIISFWQPWFSVMILVLHITSLYWALAYEPISLVSTMASTGFSSVYTPSVLQPKLLLIAF